MANQPTVILVVGMARSGTTLISHVLGSMPGVHAEIEPHALWKSGNFHYDTDEEYDITPEIVGHIRESLLGAVPPGAKFMMEKSPNNSLKPNLVHAVFPEAKLVYIERDAPGCIYSNYTRSVQKDSFKLSIILKKYFWYTGSKDLPGAISNRKLFQQIRLSDLPQFFRYTTKMFGLRRRDLLPFGPKIKNFVEVLKEKGLLGYHVEVYRKSMQHRDTFRELYKDRYAHFTMGDIMNDASSIERLFDFCGFDYTPEHVASIRATFDKDRVKGAKKQNDTVEEIKRLLQQA
jgi:hypothetical protein